MRGKLRGSIVKRYENSYSIVINLGKDPITGKRKQQWYSVKGNQKAAEKRLEELLRELDTGTLVKPSKVTLGNYMKSWLSDYAWPNLAPRTAEGYEHILNNHVAPRLGNIALTALKPEHIQKYYGDKLASGLSARTVRHHHVTLHTVLQSAVKRGMLIRNPADATDPPHFNRPEMHTIDEFNLQKFLDAAQQMEYYPIFYLALFSGMRRSELLALRWCDIDLVLCQASVSRSLHRLRKGETVICPTKTAKSRRMVALSPSTCQVLREYREYRENEALHAGKLLQDDDLIFPWPPDTITHAWLKLARRVGLKGVRFHDARHTHASLLLRQNTHPAVVQQRLGHASISTTIDIYSHIMPGLQQAAANSFDDFIRNRTPDNNAKRIEPVRRL